MAERVLLTGWGRTAPTAADVVPLRTSEDAEAALKAAGHRGVLARGLGRSYGDAAQNAGGTVLDATASASIREFDGETGTVTLDAGVSIAALLRAFVGLGWFVPVTPGTRFVTIGGAIAADIHGKNHHVDGSIGEHVERLTLLTPTGRIECSRTAEPEVFWATIGGMGLTGVIEQATLRLLPISTAQMRVDTQRAADLDALMALMESGDQDYRYSVAWLDCVTTGRFLGRAVLTRGDHATPDDLPARRRRTDPLHYDADVRISAPPVVPSGLVRPLTARLLNEAWFRKAPRRQTGAISSIPAFFHPLDGIGSWNRMYGGRGFLQYQFLVPFEAGEVVRTAIERLTAARCPSVLAVLKRFGAQGKGYLSFPAPGWTLALDIPVGPPALASVLDELDQIVVESGGRIYLAKDSRMRPELLASMYPRLDQWRAVCDRLDPDGLVRSDLDRRVGLRRPHQTRNADHA